MKIEKRNNSYRVQKMINGKSYSMTFDHKPFKHEIEARLRSIKKEISENHIYTFRRGTLEYIDIKREVLSPSTIVNYKSVLRNLSDDFTSLRVDEITSVEAQREISRYSQTHSPKSVKNASGLITTVLKMYVPGMTIKVKLPQREVVEKIVPTESDIATVLKASKGTDYELCFRLAVFGLRKSEMLAITKDDIKGNILSINKALVVNENKEYVIKQTKTAAGTRKIYIDDNLAKAIKEKGYVYNGFPGNILRELHRIQDKNGLPHFRLHDFRVYYASWCHANNIPDSYIMDSGGWKSQSTLDSIYRKSMPDKLKSLQKEIADKILPTTSE